MNKIVTSIIIVAICGALAFTRQPSAESSPVVEQEAVAVAPAPPVQSPAPAEASDQLLSLQRRVEELEHRSTVMELACKCSVPNEPQAAEVFTQPAEPSPPSPPPAPAQQAAWTPPQGYTYSNGWYYPPGYVQQGYSSGSSCGPGGCGTSRGFFGRRR